MIDREVCNMDKVENNRLIRLAVKKIYFVATNRGNLHFHLLISLKRIFPNASLRQHTLLKGKPLHYYVFRTEKKYEKI